MKTKPAQLADAKLEEFRNHNPEVEFKPEKVANRADGRDARISKTVRMRLRFSEMLRDESYNRSVKQGTKVSEADLIDEALADWQLKHQIKSD